MNAKVLLAILLCSGAALANEPVKVGNVEKYLDQQRDVREDFQYSKKFKHVDNDAKARLYQAQDQIFALLEGHEQVDELSTDQQLALYNAQNVVNSVLADAELDREICKREKTLGSHRSSLVCMTVREARNIKEVDKTMMMAPRVCDPQTNCGGG